MLDIRPHIRALKELAELREHGVRSVRVTQDSFEVEFLPLESRQQEFTDSAGTEQPTRREPESTNALDDPWTYGGGGAEVPGLPKREGPDE